MSKGARVGSESEQAARTRDVVRVVILVQERIPIEPNSLVCNPGRPKHVADSFGDEKDNLGRTAGLEQCTPRGTGCVHHGWQDVGKRACKLEHDDHDGHRDSHHATRCSISAGGAIQNGKAHT